MVALFIVGLFAYAVVDDPTDPDEVLGVASALLFGVFRAAVAPRVRIRGSRVVVVQPWAVVVVEQSHYVGVHEDGGGLTLDVVGREVDVFAFSGSLLASLLGDPPKRRLVRALGQWSRGGNDGPVDAGGEPRPGVWPVVRQCLVFLGGGQVLALLVPVVR
ncbi:hypothetical protein AB2L27_13340 [Kineococcus sp. LSe6-4]|uniref:PH domain-containing protein n=1 Tax=Kineococcus halophytocola TaxID=3234027 RepID=A0ABV4H3T7_9ACTN